MKLVSSPDTSGMWLQPVGPFRHLEAAARVQPEAGDRVLDLGVVRGRVHDPGPERGELVARVLRPDPLLGLLEIRAGEQPRCGCGGSSSPGYTTGTGSKPSRTTVPRAIVPAHATARNCKPRRWHLRCSRGEPEDSTQ